MTDTLSGGWGQGGFLPWPPRKFREELANSLHSFILDEERMLQSLGPEEDTSQATYNFMMCLHQYITERMETLSSSYGHMCNRYCEQDPNDDPYTAIAASHVTNNSTAYSTLDSSIAGPGEHINEPYIPFGQSHIFATSRRINVAQQIKDTDRAFGAGGSSLPPGELPKAGSGDSAAGGGATSIGAHMEPTSKRSRKTTPLDNSLTRTRGSRSNKRSIAQDRSNFNHKCGICGQKFQFPARLKSHLETASHAGRKYHCVSCKAEFTRQSSLTRHRDGDTACKGVRRANGTSTLGSSSGVQSVIHASAGSPPRTSYSARDSAPPCGSSADLVQTPVPNLFPPSSTSSRTTSRLNYSPLTAHAPSQPQDASIIRSSLSPAQKFIDPTMLEVSLYPMTRISQGGEYLDLTSHPS